MCYLALKAFITCIANDLWGAWNFDKFRGKSPNVMCTINKTRDQIVLTTINTKATVFSSLDGFQIIKDFKLDVRPLRAPKVI